MWTRHSRTLRLTAGNAEGQPASRRTTRPALAAALLLLLAPPAFAQDPGYKWEAEDLAPTARITGGGDLVLVRSPDPEKFPFSSGAVVSFVPRGKGATVEYIVPVDKPGVYTVRLRGVMGPSCGIYNILVNGDERGNHNWYNPVTVYTGLNPSTAWGLASKLAEFAEGDNRIGFLYQGAQGRQGNLVLDTIELLPDNYRPAAHQFSEYETRLPAGEKLGPNLVQNPGFEEFTDSDKFTAQYQTLRGWTPNSAIPRKNPIIVRDPAQAHSGNICVVLAPDPLENNVVLYQPLPVESGRRYRISFWAKGDSALNVSWYYRSPAPDAVHATMLLPIAENWQFYTYIFEPGLAAKVTSLPLALQSMDRYRQVYLDDVAVQEILP